MYHRALRASAIALTMSGAALALAPVAMADAAPNADVRQMTISVDAPKEIGFAGGPVEFTETIGNNGTSSVTETLRLLAQTGTGLSADSLTIDYRTDAGTWEPLSLTYKDGNFFGRPTETFTVAPGATQTLHLRIGLPMGTPHNGDTNGGTDHVTLMSSLVPDGQLIADVDDTHQIKVTPITSSLVGVPVSATAGGNPIQFGAKITNPTPSEYTNLSHVLFADEYATVQVFKGGHWTTLSSVESPGADLPQGFYLDGKDASFPANSSAVTKVRVSYRADHPAGHAKLQDCLIVNERPGTPFTGTTMCQPQTTLSITQGAEATPTATASAPAEPTATATTPAAPAPAAQLAETGAGSSATTAGLAAGVLLLGGGATLASARLRRRSH
jgi:hypothetical protein